MGIPRYWYAGALLLALVIVAMWVGAEIGWAQTPSDQPVLASGDYARKGITGIDESANKASTAGMTSLQTIPAATNLRYGLLIQAQCTAGLLVALSDTAGGPTYISLGAAPAAGGQGGSLNLRDLPYSGAIVIWSTSASCVYGAWVAQN